MMMTCVFEIQRLLHSNTTDKTRIFTFLAYLSYLLLFIYVVYMTSALENFIRKQHAVMFYTRRPVHTTSTAQALLSDFESRGHRFVVDVVYIDKKKAHEVS